MDGTARVAILYSLLGQRGGDLLVAAIHQFGYQPDWLDEQLAGYLWTTEKPTEPGWYWWRFDQDSSERTTEVRYVSDAALQNQILLGEWAGPLELPV